MLTRPKAIHKTIINVDPACPAFDFKRIPRDAAAAPLEKGITDELFGAWNLELLWLAAPQLPSEGGSLELGAWSFFTALLPKLKLTLAVDSCAIVKAKASPIRKAPVRARSS